VCRWIFARRSEGGRGFMADRVGNSAGSGGSMDRASADPALAAANLRTRNPGVASGHGTIFAQEVTALAQVGIMRDNSIFTLLGFIAIIRTTVLVALDQS